jgi:hypothetical protein
LRTTPAWGLAIGEAPSRRRTRTPAVASMVTRGRNSGRGASPEPVRQAAAFPLDGALAGAAAVEVAVEVAGRAAVGATEEACAAGTMIRVAVEPDAADLWTAFSGA